MRQLGENCGSAPCSTFGYAIATADLDHSARRAVILRDCTSLTPEYEGKWDAVCQADGSLDFAALDCLADFAKAHGLALHGHTLCWHGSIPRQFTKVDAERFRAAATVYWGNAVDRYRGVMRSWHVVNEPLYLPDGRDDGLRLTPYLQAFGPPYLHELFQLVASRDPHAVLVLNEMGLEDQSPEADAKRRAMLRLLESALRHGVPIHALGLQSHLDAATFLRGGHERFARWLRDVTDLGLRVSVTELDVDDRGLEGNIVVRDAASAEVYREYLALVRDNALLRDITVWGLSDDRSWLNAEHIDPAARPLLFDEHLIPKQAWHEMTATTGQTI
ncbi:endo-1,4-beta-xylanase [Devosia lucknowensis]|uniref:Beta-xylanase n=1 Tax=Devosia lucknowensis TaxID=1096929 RepID=A0A1Y6G5S7_9HYPH|nr:endo-1,4-beta-xylanase [Devosia lucknowensis]SMQ85512.1 endo-1,4-beta-xylanase [Devosia lucknowensis]